MTKMTSNNKEMPEETLYDKKVKLDMCDCDKEAYWEEDVKEAVRKLIKKCGLREEDTFALAINLDDLKEIFGEKLIWKIKNKL